MFLLLADCSSLLIDVLLADVCNDETAEKFMIGYVLFN